jgi:hypothetical protein
MLTNDVRSSFGTHRPPALPPPQRFFQRRRGGGTAVGERSGPSVEEEVGGARIAG